MDLAALTRDERPRGEQRDVPAVVKTVAIVALEGVIEPEPPVGRTAQTSPSSSTSAATTRGSNCVPAHRRSSSTALAGGIAER
jgi:hypothetical protein